VYRDGDAVQVSSDITDISKDNDLVERTTLDSSGVEEALEYLDRQDLIQMIGVVNSDDESAKREVQLTPKGFDVAHERELSLRDNASNYATTALTGILVLSSIVQGLITYVSEDLGSVDTAMLGALIIANLVVFYIIWRQLNRAGAVDIDGLVERRNRLE